ncbi:MAG: transporter family protein ATP-binding cassette, subfamily er 3 [Candidatus Taylorbacteria bacterium]|nr:transporter family protein ATP-binding cassette, subfamily er 3 [Candidatus Taylorbacteria bacterium]
MAKADSIVSFEKASFEYGVNKPILESVDFTIRRGTKTTIMGQNGAGKSTIFGLITKVHTPDSGKINISERMTIAISRQVIPRDELDLTVRAFFEKSFKEKKYDIDPRIDEVLEAVNLKGHDKVHDRIIGSFSGGQQARILLASALIQNPDLLLLDEPTNNLDKAGIEHLTKFLIDYKKTVIVISHDADFLNAFTDGVLYLDIYTRKVEQYPGNYFVVLRDIEARMERENRKNAQLAKEIQDNKDKANFFANKGGQMRLVAKRMRDKAEELEEEKVDVRKEDKTIRPFIIPAENDLSGDIVAITGFTVLGKNHKPVQKRASITLRKGHHLLLKGPNGIGKSTLLESIAQNKAAGVVIKSGTRIGYYKQDFSMLDFKATVYDCLMSAMGKKDEQIMRGVAAGFLLTGEIMKTYVGNLSEGQKGLVAFARLCLERPGLLILDEPTNHINFRHLPIIAEALSKFEGAMIMVSHVPEFVSKIKINEILDLEK